ncbi:MAG: serine/threonine-protein kinase [Isosphaeraceae bacterium]
MPKAADRHLLFGLLALQTGLVRQDQLVAAFHAWTADKSRPIDDHLVALGALNEAQQAAIGTLADLHIEAHGGDPGKSLASIPIGPSTRVQLASLADTDLDATLSHAGPSPTLPDDDPTATFPIGSATAEGRRFQILRPHAQGGLGAVYVALDSELNREVALKQILENHADDPISRGRFLVEAEITGGLEHPGIVPVYGLGTYGDGRPYYAMRFIRGDSLREAIDAFHKRPKSDPNRSLEFRQLLKKFTDVCNAIEYAHSRGVLHRDIKPGNVIVGKHGETLVVDWGLAKALGKSAADAAERTLIPSSADGSSETLPGQAMGTPAYMGPEQARGDLEKLGPRSDVYSLGATLYYLLTGQAPFQGHPAAVLKAVEQGDFPRPRSRDASIDPALETIVLKAMAKVPADRYASARDLAADVDRWLADERVEAYPEPWTRGLNRWLARHRTGVTGIAAAGIVALIGLGIVSAVQTKARQALDVANGKLTEANRELTASNAELEIQRQRAEEREGQAIDAVKRFKDVIADNPDLKNNPALESLRRTLLKEPLAFFGRLRERLQAAEDTRPESLVRLAGIIEDYAHLADEIGDIRDALKVHEDSLAIWERLVRDQPGRDEYQSGLATLENCRGNFLKRTGRPDEALAAHERALAIYERLAGDHPTLIWYQARLADSHNNVGNLLDDIGRPDEARGAHERALAIRERLAGDHPTVTEYQADLALSNNNLGAVLDATGRTDEALAAHERALAIRERLAGDQPTITEYQADLAASYYNLGALLGNRGRTDEALAAYGRAIAIYGGLADDHPTVIGYQARIADSLNNVGNLLDDIGRPHDALAAHERALAIHDRLAGDHPNVAWYQAALAASHTNLGTGLNAAGRTDEARAVHERALTIYERLVGNHPEVPDHASGLGIAWNNLAMIDLQASGFAEARENLLKAISWQKKALDANPRHPRYRQYYANHLRNLIGAERGLGHDDEATRIRRELAEFRLHDPEFEPLDARLKAVLNGEEARENAERLALARRAYDTERFATAAKLWGEAFDSDSKLADSRNPQHRYNAACAAALAASGDGTDPPADGEAKGHLRASALGWLKAELVAWSPFVEQGPPQARAFVAKTLQHWQKDADLAGIREADSLANLPEDERRSWQAFWEEVEALLKRASTPD